MKMPSFFDVNEVPLPLLSVEQKKFVRFLFALLMYFKDKGVKNLDFHKLYYLFKSKRARIGNEEYIIGQGVDNNFIVCHIVNNKTIPISLNRYMLEERE